MNFSVSAHYDFPSFNKHLHSGFSVQKMAAELRKKKSSRDLAGVKASTEKTTKRVKDVKRKGLIRCRQFAELS
jgi:hypothetical protein